MEDSLRNWCSESFTQARTFCLASFETTPDEAVLRAEQCVELAAFLKLAESRGVTPPDAFARNAAVEYGLIGPFVQRCPLGAADPPELLGAIHEQFVARRGLSAASGPRRRSRSQKSGGIFYTPQPVIDYIVRKTLGPRLAGKTPSDVEHLTVLDPSAGCGAFLLESFRFLADWYLNWYVGQAQSGDTADLVKTEEGWKLSARRCQSILQQHLFGVDLDRFAIETTRRTLWLVICDCVARHDSSLSRDGIWDALSGNMRSGHALLGRGFGPDSTITVRKPRRSRWFGKEVDSGEPRSHRQSAATASPLDWASAFSAIVPLGGFDVVIGNPPYRRERDYKRELDEIAETPLGRHRSPRMDLWYYFVHRGIELLRDGGSLSFITNAYWMEGRGAGKLIAALRDDVQLDELFLLEKQPIFEGIVARHVIFRLTKVKPDHRETTIRITRESHGGEVPLKVDLDNTDDFVKSRSQLFSNGRLHVWPAADRLLEKLNRQARLKDLGVVRQGIAENPACINRRTIERFPQQAICENWVAGEGVFCLPPEDVERLGLSGRELALIRPYHTLADLGRYWSAERPGCRIIYATRETCPDLDEFPLLRRHLARFRGIMEARRETRLKANRWWHLHWPRDERIWQRNKLIVLQMARRPSFVATLKPTYVPFSANAFVPGTETREDLLYLCGVLNSRTLWAWFAHHAKHRGIGLELNGHVLEQAPIPKIDFSEPRLRALHDEIVELVTKRMAIGQLVENCLDDRLEGEKVQIEGQIDLLVEELFGLGPDDRALVGSVIGDGQVG